VHVAAPAALNVPAAHGEHDVAPEALNLPAAQAMHTPLLPSVVALPAT
jgi:hypothetical protein